MIAGPLTVIENKWEAFQSYNHSYLKDLLPGMVDQLHFVTMTYIPEEIHKSAALNFHLTQREKQDLENSIYQQQNQAAAQELMRLLGK